MTFLFGQPTLDHDQIRHYYRIVDHQEIDKTESVDNQLAAIRSFSQLLDAAEIDYWLFGGWAVDFWVGGITRPHDDIDVAAWRHDYDSIKSTLVAADWEHTPTAEDMVGTRYRLGTAQVEFTFVEQGDAGQVVVRLPTGAVTWSSDPFGDSRAQLRGVTPRTIPLAVLTAGKATPRQGAAEGAKDRADFEALCRLVNQ